MMAQFCPGEASRWMDGQTQHGPYNRLFNDYLSWLVTCRVHLQVHCVADLREWNCVEFALTIQVVQRWHQILNAKARRPQNSVIATT